MPAAAGPVRQSHRAQHWLRRGPNALIEVDETLCVERNAEEIHLEQGEGTPFVVVGHFPFVPSVRVPPPRNAGCWSWCRAGLSAGRACPEIIPQADVVAIPPA